MRYLTFERQQLAEVEFELNRRDILRFRTLILHGAADGSLTLLSPIHTENAYLFHPGDRVDLTAPADGTLWRFKAVVTAVTREEGHNVLKLRQTSDVSPSQSHHFYSIRVNREVLVTAGAQGVDGPSLQCRLSYMDPWEVHLRHDRPLPAADSVSFYLELEGQTFQLSGTAVPQPVPKDSDSVFHTLVRLTPSPGAVKELQQTILNLQRRYILGMADRSLVQNVESNRESQDLILEHLVPRSGLRVALDALEALGWIMLFIILVYVMKSMPPTVSLFDRLFRLRILSVWDTETLALVQYLCFMLVLDCFTAWGLHGWIRSVGNIRIRRSLVALSLLALWMLFLILQLL